MLKKRYVNNQNILRNLCQSGVEQTVFPGCMAAISIGSGFDRQRFIEGAGKLACEEPTHNVNRATLFDLASLTKPLCTSLCILQLIKQGLVSWDTLLADCLQEAKNAPHIRNISIEQLLTHSSGLQAYIPYFRNFRSYFANENKKKILTYICQSKKKYRSGTQNIYSDLGYILLGEIIEQKTGQRLDHFFIEKISRKLGMEKDLFFIPLGQAGAYEPVQNCAATEKCSWRGRVIQGEVHDEHCWLMGGVAGHAGLFGTIDGVLRLCEFMLDQWVDENNMQALSGKLFQQLFTIPNNKLHWYRGFDRPTPGSSSSGRYFSEKSAGHLGFSGTSFWMDPEKKIVTVLLTNRINFSRKNLKIRYFRPCFHDKLMEFFLYEKKPC